MSALILSTCHLLGDHTGLLTCLLVLHRLGFKGGRLIFEALAPNVTMQELHVGGNNFGDGVVPFMVKYLANTDNTLRVFSIGNNDITAKGICTWVLLLMYVDECHAF